MNEKDILFEKDFPKIDWTTNQVGKIQGWIVSIFFVRVPRPEN